MREWILTSLGNPHVAAVVLALGLLLVVAELLRPGKAIAGALGGVMTVLSLWSLLPQHLETVVAVAVCSFPFGAVLMRIALRARRNKLR